MKKETLGAIIFGIVLGGILAVVLIAKNKEKQLEKNKAITSVEKVVNSQAGGTNFQQLEITDPADGMIINKNSITIKGNVNRDSLIVIQSPIKDLLFRNDKVQFSVDFPLAFGENLINIVVYPKDPQQRSQEKKLKIYYLDQQL